MGRGETEAREPARWFLQYPLHDQNRFRHDQNRFREGEEGIAMRARLGTEVTEHAGE